MSTDTEVHNIAPPLAVLASPLTNLTGLPGNPRKGDIDKIAKSLRVFGQRKPVTARKTGEDEHGQPVGYVTAGNHTMQGAEKLGWTHIAVVWFDEDETTANAWALADNRLSEIGSNDADALAIMLAQIAEDGDPDLFEATAYTDEDLAKLLDDGMPPPGDADQLAIPQQYGVMVDCDNEQMQAELLTRLAGEGYTVRALM